MMNKIKLYTYSGKWFLPGSPKLKLDGVLTINKIDKTIELKIYSNKYFNGQSIGSDFKYLPYHPIILGDCFGGVKVSVLECNWRGITKISEDLFCLSFESDFVLDGCHFEKPESVKFRGLTCSIPYFSRWFEGNIVYYDVNSENSNVAYEEKIFPIEVNDQFSIVVTRKVENTGVQSLFTKQVNLQVKHLIEFVYLNESAYYIELIKKAYSLKKLIEISSSKSLYLNYYSAIIERQAVIDFSYPYRKNDFAEVGIWYFNKGLKEVDDNLISSNKLIFSKRNLETQELISLIKNWFTQYDKFSVVINNYLDCNNWPESGFILSEIMFNTRLLNLIQALESYHTILNSEIDDSNFKLFETKKFEILQRISNEEDKDWIEKRIFPEIKTLANRLKEIIQGFELKNALFKNSKELDSFIYKLKKIRDDLSHGNKLEYPPETVEYLYKKTRTIVVFCVLSILGFSNVKIKDLLDM